MADVRTVKRIDLTDCPPGSRRHLALESVADGLGWDLYLPVLMVRGIEDGPVLGLTAAVHGNELNGIPAIHRLLERLEPRKLRGAVVALPVVNTPGYHRNQRHFADGTDLNRIFPGLEGGTQGQVFAARFLDRAIASMTHLVDLHTASFGRVNSLYIRADLHNPVSEAMARAFEPQILLHNRGNEGTLRDAAADLGIPAITVEIGNPQRIQDDLVGFSVAGLTRVMEALDMVERSSDHTPPGDTIVCGRSYWLYTDRGGVLEVFPRLASRVHEGERIAAVRDIYGTLRREVWAPEDGVVIGKSTNPVNQTGSRILHLGVEGPPEAAPTAPDE